MHLCSQVGEESHGTTVTILPASEVMEEVVMEDCGVEGKVVDGEEVVGEVTNYPKLLMICTVSNFCFNQT